MRNRLIVTDLTPETSEAFQLLAFSKGYVWERNQKTISCPLEKELSLGDDNHIYWHPVRDGSPVISALEFNKIIDFFVEPAPFQFVLNCDYTAVIDKNGVKVGCETFSHSVVLGLADVVNKYLDEVKIKS